MSNPVFKVGDRVMSKVGGCDRTYMNNVYRGKIINIRYDARAAEDGCAYHIRGQWDNDTHNEGVTVRQLWARNLEIDNGN